MRQRAAVPIAVTVFAALMVGSTASTAARGSLDSDTVVVLFVDDLHIEFRSTPAVRDVLINRILPSVIGGGQKVGIVTTGYSPISLAPTSDRAILLARLRTITGGGLRPDAVLRQHAERIRRAQVALSVAKDTIAALAVRGTGRTLLIYLSDGYGEPELAGEL